MRGYLVQPSGNGPFPAILADPRESAASIPTSRTVARRVATEGFLALAPDGLFRSAAIRAMTMTAARCRPSSTSPSWRTDMLNSARYVKAHQLSNGKLGATRLLLGGGHHQLPRRDAVAPICSACVPYYRRRGGDRVGAVDQGAADGLSSRRDRRPTSTACRPPYEAALKAANAPYEAYIYPGTQHGFHNNSTPRYRKAAAQAVVERTIAFFKKNVA